MQVASFDFIWYFRVASTDFIGILVGKKGGFCITDGEGRRPGEGARRPGRGEGIKRGSHLRSFSMEFDNLSVRGG